MGLSFGDRLVAQPQVSGVSSGTGGGGLGLGLPRFCGRLRGLAEQDLGCGFWAVLLFVDEG